MNKLQNSITGAKVKLPYYGVHTDENHLTYLFQDTCPQGWNFYGVQNEQKATVKHLRNGCSHIIQPSLALRSIPIKHWEKFSTLLKDPLIQTMLPIPNGGAYFFCTNQLENSDEWLSCLERLNSPLHKWVRPMWTVNKIKLLHQLQLTNLHPIVLTHVDETQLGLANQYVQAQRGAPRTLVLAGETELVFPKHVIRLKTRVSELISLSDLISLPLEHIGVHILSEYCLGKFSLEDHS